MAEAAARGAEEAGAAVTLKAAATVTPDDLLAHDGIMVGSPTYYGGMAWEVKKMFDDSVKVHRKLEGKVGAAFSTSANIGGGNETTNLAIIQAMLIHGMIVPGIPLGDHYGPVGINAPDDRALTQARHLGKRVAVLAQQLFPA